jgi:hypothetical protein
MINSRENRDIEAELDEWMTTVTLKSLKTYELVLCNVITFGGLMRVLDADETDMDRFVGFSDPEDCAEFIYTKYSDGLKPHKHVWDLAIQAVVYPAYTVGCLVPGCPAELVVPPWIAENDSKVPKRKIQHEDT